MFKLLEENCKKGTKVFKDYTIYDNFKNKTIIPYYVIVGEEDGPVICITSGVHGTEYPGIGANLKLYQDIIPSNLKGTIIGCPMCNYEAFIHRTMFVNPLDQKNLNNLFPGNSNGSITEKIAHTLLNEFVSKADYHIDMHSGDSIEHLYPYVFYHKNQKDKKINEISRKMAQTYALDYIAVTELDGNGASDKGNFYSCSSELGIPSIQPEIGGIGLIENKTKMLHYNGVRNVLSYFKMIEAHDTTTNNSQIELSSFYRLSSDNDGVFNAFVEPGQKINKGDILANITDYHGVNELEVLTAKDNGVVLWLMSSLAAKKGDTLMAIGVD